MRASKPSKREESTASAGSAASSSTSAWSSCRPCGVSAITRAGRAVAVDGVERGGDDVDPQHHARAAAVRRVVDLAGAQRGRVAVVEEPQLELGAEDGRERLLLGQPAEGVRNLGEDVETHPGQGIGQSMKPGLRSTTPSAGSIAAIASSIIGTRVPSSSSRLSLAGPGSTSRTIPSGAAALLLDAQADELEGVELALGRAAAASARRHRQRIARARPGGRAGSRGGRARPGARA